MAGNFKDNLRYRLQIKQKGLKMFYKACTFMNDFRMKPSMIRKDWKDAGAILVHLGIEGEAEWQKLLMKDSAAWNLAEYTDCYLKIITGDIPIPKCNDIACYGLCNNCFKYISPLDIIYEHAATRRQGIQYGKLVSTLNSARGQLQKDCRNLLNGGLHKGGIYHFGAPNGLGKTTHLVEELLLKLSYKSTSTEKVLILTPRHNLSDEIVNKINPKNQPTRCPIVKLASRRKLIDEGSLHCPHSTNLEYAGKHGYPIASLYCMKCLSKNTCEYYKRFNDAASAKIVIGVHDHLHHPIIMNTVVPSLIIIDECFLSLYRKQVDFTDQDIAFTEKVITNSYLCGTPRANLLSALRSVSNGKKPARHTLQWTSNNANTVWDAIVNSLQIMNSTASNRLLIYDLIYLAQYQTDLWKSGKKYSYIRSALLPPDVPLIILDSTTTTEQYERLLGKPVQSVSLPNDAPIEHHVQVTQILDGQYPRGSLLEYNNGPTQLTNIASKLLRTMALYVGGKEWNLITHKSVADKVTQDLFNITGGGLITYFGNVSGLNDLENADIVTVMGFPLLGYNNLVQQARIAFDTGWHVEEIIEQTKKVWMDAGADNWGHLSFHDEITGVECHISKYSEISIEDISQIIEQGNFIQALGRIRPFDTKMASQGSGFKHRQLFVLSNQLTGAIPIDRAIKHYGLRSLFLLPKNKTQLDTLAVITDMIEVGIDPDKISYSTIIKHSGIMNIPLNPNTLKSQLSRYGGKKRFINTASIMAKTPNLKSWILGSIIGADATDNDNNDNQVHLLDLTEQYSETSSIISSVAAIELTTLVLNTKARALREFAEGPSFNDLARNRRIEIMIRILREEINMGDYSMRLDCFNSLDELLGLIEHAIVQEIDANEVLGYEQDPMWE